MGYENCETALGKTKERRSFERPMRWLHGNIKMDIKDHVSRVWAGFIYLRTETGGRLLRAR